MKETRDQEDRMEMKNSLNWMFEIIKNVKKGEHTAHSQGPMHHSLVMDTIHVLEWQLEHY